MNLYPYTNQTNSPQALPLFGSKSTAITSNNKAAHVWQSKRDELTPHYHSYALKSSLYSPIEELTYYDNPSVILDWKPAYTSYPVSFKSETPHSSTKIAEVGQSKVEEISYSSSKKEFYPIVPYSGPFHYAPVSSSFDDTRVQQTDVLELISSKSSFSALGNVSLAKTISPLWKKMGTITDTITGENVGTCTLIASNLVLVARHSVEGHDIRFLTATFGYTKLHGSVYSVAQTSFTKFIEEDAQSDYAIIKLKEPLGSHLGFVSLNISNQTCCEPALLHYPLGKPLKVSVHEICHTQYQSDHLLAYHDSDYFSSGGAYFDTEGRMIAIHLGAELQGETMNLFRYALPLEAIVRRNPHSLVGKLAGGELSQAFVYDNPFSNSFFLNPVIRDFLIDEEGRESEKSLRKLLGSDLKDKNIKKNKNGTISFSDSNLEYIANKYGKKYDAFEEECLGKTGLHKLTRLYSVTGVIESDHTIPHHVWAATKNPKMKQVLTGSGKRSGENDMPAITIPYDIHRNLLTTGGVAGYQQFHEILIDLCDKDEIDEALIKCYEEYKSKGLDLQAYKTSIKKSLEDHVSLGLITKGEKRKIIQKIF